MEESEAYNTETVDMQSVMAALGLLSGTFLAVLIGLRVYLHCMRRRPQREMRRKKMTQADIEQRFPVSKSAGGETCVVCLSNIDADDECRVTQCGHTFHAECLLAWWVHRPRRILRCPICRTRQRSSADRVRHRKDRRSIESVGAAVSAIGDFNADGPAETTTEMS